MDIVESLAIICALQIFACHANPPEAQYCDNACEQCNEMCLAEPNANGEATVLPYRPVGPRGEKGKRGRRGDVGAPGDWGRKGLKGSPGSPDIAEIEKLIDRTIKQALYGGVLSRGSPYRSCRDARNDPTRGQNVASGMVNISNPALGLIEVYCDFKTDGGDWIVFQRRMNGHVDFYRDWNEYVGGFGDMDGEFWLGLEAIHQLTSRGTWEMRTELVTVDDDRFFVKYSQFRIGSKAENYKLSLSGFFGNTTNSLRKEHGGQPFSTRDADHDDNSDLNCAAKWHGAWWYKNCGNLQSNLNGRYGSRRYEGLSWYRPSLGWTTMKFTEMKIRPVLQ